MRYFFFSLVFLSVSIVFLGCSDDKNNVAQDNDIASHLKLMPIDNADLLNPTGNKRLCDDIQKQMPIIKLN